MLLSLSSACSLLKFGKLSRMILQTACSLERRLRERPEPPLLDALFLSSVFSRVVAASSSFFCSTFRAASDLRDEAAVRL